MDVIKKIQPAWFAVAVLVVVVIVLMFRQSRSGYTPNAGAPITLMDLQEYSAFSPAQKANYANKLMTYQPRLMNAALTKSTITYQNLLNEVMNQTVNDGTMPAAFVPQVKCMPGQFSPSAYQPQCIPCPPNTFCPNQGTTTPTPCPPGKRSPAGSILMTACR